MDERNITRITIIHMLGFQIQPSMRFVIFVFLLLSYCVTIYGNLLIITLVSYSKTLHTPMYFFLSQLSVSDIIIVTDIHPKMLHAVLQNGTIISLSGCLAQFFFFAFSEASQCLLLTLMAYDRYLAICKPLHYSMIMSHRVCFIAIIIFWTICISVELSQTLLLSQLQFCGPNKIDHFFCDLHPVVALSCSDSTFVELEVTLAASVFAVFPFIIIIVSYVYIIVTIFNISSITGRQKAFSTCSSHLTVVSIYYSTMVAVYLAPTRGQTWNFSKLFSLLYTVVTPLMNPIIYSLRNRDLKKVLVKLINSFLNLLISRYKCCH